MLGKDYFLKLIEPFSQILPQLLHLKQKGHYEEALAVIQRTGQGLTGLEARLLDTLSAQSILVLLGADNPGSKAQCLALATLFVEQGKVYDLQPNVNQANVSYLKALDIYSYILSTSEAGEIEDYVDGVDQLVDRLDSSTFPATTLQSLFRLYAAVGYYDRAEDMLFRALDLDSSDESLIDEGIAFYEALLSRNDAELIAGNLPRDEVESGLQEMLDLKAVDGDAE